MSEFADSKESKLGAPAAALAALAALASEGASSGGINTVELREKLNEALWWREEYSETEDQEGKQRRLRAQAWVLGEIQQWSAEGSNDVACLQVYLTTLLNASESDKTAAEVLPPETMKSQFRNSLRLLLMARNVVPTRRYQQFGAEQLSAFSEAGRSKNFRYIDNQINHISVEFSPEVHLAILIAKRLVPDLLSQCIADKDDAVFAMGLKDVLGDEAIVFAQEVNNVTFKLVCLSSVAGHPAKSVSESTLAAARVLLLQIAQTPDWKAVLRGIARYPRESSVLTQALPDVLAQLTPEHWAAFIEATELWTHASTVIGVTEILAGFFNRLKSDKTVDMWRLAYERWDEWDYGAGQPNGYLHSTSVCSFDFPVAMYYASLPIDDWRAAQTDLIQRIEAVEQHWFKNMLELTSARNRLTSRLRLVGHGASIRDWPGSGPADALPKPVAPESEYARIRYQFFNVNAAVGRMR